MKRLIARFLRAFANKEERKRYAQELHRLNEYVNTLINRELKDLETTTYLNRSLRCENDVLRKENCRLITELEQLKASSQTQLTQQ